MIGFEDQSALKQSNSISSLKDLTFEHPYIQKSDKHEKYSIQISSVHSAKSSIDQIDFHKPSK